MQLPCRRVRRPRRVGLDRGRRPLVRRRWRRGYGVSRPYGPGCLPGHRDCLKRHDSPGFDAGRLLRPLVPRERSLEVSRGRRLPYLMPMSPAIGRMAHRVRSAPAARRSSGMAHPCPRGCISRRSSTILAYRATALRHLGVAIHELCLARPHRISTGRLVSQSVGMAPDHAATGRLPHGRYDSASTKAAPEKNC